MRFSPLATFTAPVIALNLLTAPMALAESHTHDHGHEHEQTHTHSADDAEIYKGYFDDDQIAPRALSDWAGDWQSVFPYLQNGTLDPVMAHKAESGSMTAEEYRAYYETGYATEINRIVITADTVAFHGPDGVVTGTYEEDGYEILTYEKGNRGVRFIFEKIDGDASAPAVIQFSDHHIFPTKVDHFHLYWGADRAALLEELSNWPTYYPTGLSGEEIVAEMLAH